LVVSPGVPPSIQILQSARQKGIPIFSELEFASWACRGSVIAVTGSNGKTTTTTLLGEIFAAAGFNTHACGNIGRPFSEVALHVDPKGVAVVEVSTFQLEGIADFRPRVALILNLSADHLDRHGTFENYKALKYRITENQTSDDYLILNAQDSEILRDNVATGGRKVWFTTTGDRNADAFVAEGDLYGKFDGQETAIIECRNILIPGPHNLQNAAAAVCAAALFDVAPATIAQVLRSFPGVEHRMEKVGRVAGVQFINDSKATNVDSVCYALRSIDTPLYLIAGGRDKGNDYRPFITYGRDKIKSLVLIGEAAHKIADALGRTFPVQFADSLEEAVRVSFELAHPGETVLLSPGCASFDMFDNFEHRGRVFKDAVTGLKHAAQENRTVSGKTED
ncbi:MAG TPA: UDP-N-acetylmuramoyl-L-alanine--D-glutamate ligase, partial [Candidatus Deferrimicrobium sp.]|nr:UDP-N-acetylmuramoyl-L-alanine--D-glutamate ligase [Candidatus Deferrimicrobium sp.]